MLSPFLEKILNATRSYIPGHPLELITQTLCPLSGPEFHRFLLYSLFLKVSNQRTLLKTALLWQSGMTLSVTRFPFVAGGILSNMGDLQVHQPVVGNVVCVIGCV